MSEEISLGSVGVTEDSLDFLRSICNLDKKQGGGMEDRPFDTIAGAFKFAFALGYSKRKRLKKKASAGNIAPRAFNARDFLVILSEECKKEGLSLGALASEYAEGGIETMTEQMSSGESILQLIK